MLTPTSHRRYFFHATKVRKGADEYNSTELEAEKECAAAIYSTTEEESGEEDSSRALVPKQEKATFEKSADVVQEKPYPEWLELHNDDWVGKTDSKGDVPEDESDTDTEDLDLGAWFGVGNTKAQESTKPRAGFDSASGLTSATAKDGGKNEVQGCQMDKPEHEAGKHCNTDGLFKDL